MLPKARSRKQTFTSLLSRPAASRNPAMIFAALGDGTRLFLLAQLSDGQGRSINRLSSATELTRQAVTKHLRVLEEVGLVTSLKVGRESRFSFRPEPIATVQTYLDSVSRQWDDALARLRSLVERDD